MEFQPGDERVVTKILHVLNSAKIGGTESWVLDFCSYFGKSSVSNRVFLIREAGPFLSRFGIKPRRRRAEEVPIAGRLIRIVRLSWEISKYQPNQVWLHSDEGRLYASFLFRRSPLFIAVCHSQWGLDNHIRHLRKWKPRRRWDRVVVVSPSLAESYAERFGLGPTENRPTVVLPPPQIDLQQLSSPRNPIVMGYAARMVPGKGHRLLLKAFEIVVQNCHDARLLLAGDGELRSDIERWIEDLDLREKVWLLGETLGQGVLLNNLGIYLLPSESEGMPRSGLEAALHGVPLVCFDLPAYKSFAKPALNSIIFSTYSPLDMAQGIMRAIDDYSHLLTGSQVTARELNIEFVSAFDLSLSQIESWHRT